MKVPVVNVLIVAGLHVPVIPLPDIFGNAGGVLLMHSDLISVKVGIMLLETAIFIFVSTAH